MSHKSFKTLIEFEKKIGEHLLSEKQEVSIKALEEEISASDSDRLVFKIMTEKINQKYSNLSNSEREIISNYTFYSSNQKE